MGLQLLGSLTPARFLSQYWQKKPLLVRQAIPAFAGIVQPSALFRLAARENVESKLFVRRGSRRTARDGPLNPRALCSLLHHWYLHGWLLIGERHG
jgi:50S ribosomal protein L16 3-hydroxylase